MFPPNDQSVFVPKSGTQDPPETVAFCAEIAAQFADVVDSSARFPVEVVDALRSTKLLGAMVPVEFGGQGWQLDRIGMVVENLARACGTTAMVFAMHQVQVACLVNHARTPTLQMLLRRVADDQLLLASVSTERSETAAAKPGCFVDWAADGRRATLRKDASVMRYVTLADVILVTARRSMQAPPSDQVMVAATADAYALQLAERANNRGVRAIDSCGCELTASISADAVFGQSFAEISRRTMSPVVHILYGHLWVGLAGEIVARARKLCRADSPNDGKPLMRGPSFGDLQSRLHSLRALVADATHTYEQALAQWKSNPVATEQSVDGLLLPMQMNVLKLAGSKMVVDLITDAIAICGISAYQGSPNSFDPPLRDAYASE